jgi:flagellar biosynthesis GTPase FlhF
MSNKRKIGKDKLLAALIEFRQKYRRYPTLEDFEARLMRPCIRTYRNTFGPLVRAHHEAEQFKSVGGYYEEQRQRAEHRRQKIERRYKKKRRRTQAEIQAANEQALAQKNERANKTREPKSVALPLRSRADVSQRHESPPIRLPRPYCRPPAMFQCEVCGKQVPLDEIEVIDGPKDAPTLREQLAKCACRDCRDKSCKTREIVNARSYEPPTRGLNG